MGNKKGRTLYFEGAGWSGADISKATIGNCRIRTAFHLDNGKAVYLEIIGASRTKNSHKEIYKWQYTGFIDTCYYITDERPNDDCNKYRIPCAISSLEYTEAEILRFVNSLGASFNAIKVLPDLGGYHVFPENRTYCGLNGYYYGDEFNYEPEIVARREAIYQRIYEIEKNELQFDMCTKGGKFVHSPSGETYPNFSLWVDEFNSNVLHLLRHYNGYNKHWTIQTDVGDTVEDCIAAMKETPLGRDGC